MEIHLTPETEKRLHALAAQCGGATVDELLQEVIEEYFGDLAQARQTLDKRYDDLESGRVKPVPGGPHEKPRTLESRSALTTTR